MWARWSLSIALPATEDETMRRVRVVPSKAISAVGMIGGIAFALLGLFVAIPLFGAFGILWTSIAAAIAIFHAINVFSDRGVAITNIDVDGPLDPVGTAGIDNPADTTPPPASNTPLPFDERLRRLEALRQDR